MRAIDSSSFISNIFSSFWIINGMSNRRMPKSKACVFLHSLCFTSSNQRRRWWELTLSTIIKYSLGVFDSTQPFFARFRNMTLLSSLFWQSTVRRKLSIYWWSQTFTRRRIAAVISPNLTSQCALCWWDVRIGFIALCSIVRVGLCICLQHSGSR